tara:strand:- start:295 stop:666 length:372 start_codon:yes stop_codon:yes gene_type:complete
MKKIEKLAYLFAAIMDSDGKVSIKELNSWYQIVQKRWPEFAKDQAGYILKNALYRLKSQNQKDRINNIEIVLKFLNNNLNRSDLDNLAKDLSKMIQADGLISIEEINLAGLLNWKLGLNIHFN